MHTSTETSPITLTTEKPGVIIRQLVPDDAAIFFESIQDNRNHLSRFSPSLLTMFATYDDAKKFIPAALDQNSQIRFGIWDDTEFAGSIGVSPIRDEAHIAYWLCQEHTGKGYATMACKALTEYSRGRFNRLKASVEEDNLPSQRVLARSGFYECSKILQYLIFRSDIPTL